MNVELGNYIMPHIYELSKKPNVCALCEEYTTNALDYLNENKTQLEIIDILHNTCYQLHSFKYKCITLVDYYAPLFFLEISTIQPEEFYLKVNLCQLITYIPLQVQEDTSGFCEDIIIGTSLKVCNSVEKYANKSIDICTAIYAMQIFNSGWPASLSFRFLWKQHSNIFVVYLLQKISIYITTH
ncbi:hypothetical protein GmHk_04G010940 [Glycine max]|nr:hypothetical protein GmHk_04G010940 [Glycine max]